MEHARLLQRRYYLHFCGTHETHLISYYCPDKKTQFSLVPARVPHFGGNSCDRSIGIICHVRWHTGDGNKKRAGSVSEKCLLRSPSGMISSRCQDLAAPCLFWSARLCFAPARALWQIKEKRTRALAFSNVSGNKLRIKSSAYCKCRGAQQHCVVVMPIRMEMSFFVCQRPRTMPTPFGCMRFETQSRVICHFSDAFLCIVLLYNFSSCFNISKALSSKLSGYLEYYGFCILSPHKIPTIYIQILFYLQNFDTCPSSVCNLK